MPGFLAHLVPWVDEIVIVDDGSTDSTASRAAAGGNKVKFIPSPRSAGQYFSHQRNKGIAVATSDWLLHMDIDERVPPDMAQEILAAIEDPAKDGYRFRRLNFFLHRPVRGGGWQNWNLVHLARREKFGFGGKMHETPLLNAPAERIGQLRSCMWHLNDADYFERIRKSNVYMEVEAETWAERAVRIRWYDILLRPPWYFVRPFFLQGGWRDGVVGLIWALHCATGSVRFFSILWDRQHGIPRQDIECQLHRAWEQLPPRFHNPTRGNCGQDPAS